MADKDNNITGSVFWILIISLAMTGLIYLGIWAYINENIKAGLTSLIFSIMILFSIVITQFKLFDQGNSWGKNCFWLTMGFLLYLGLLSFGDFLGQNTLAMTDTYLLSTLYAEMPILLNTILKTIVIPLAEETLWIFAMPVVLFFLLEKVGTKYKFLNNKIIQLLIIVAITSITFFVFHVGKMNWIFILPAISFRALTVLFVYGDQKLDIFKKLDVVPAFAVGCHIGNNMATEGVGKVLAVYSTSIVGFMVIGFFVLIFGSALNYILGFFLRRGEA